MAMTIDIAATNQSANILVVTISFYAEQLVHCSYYHLKGENRKERERDRERVCTGRERERARKI